MTYNKEYSREYYKKNKEKILLYHKGGRDRTGYKGKNNAEQQRRRRKIHREEIISLLGRKCVRCGFTDKRALQIDHVNGGGTKDTWGKKNGLTYYKEVISHLKAGGCKFQLLCANCNWIKRHENNEHC